MYFEFFNKEKDKMCLCKLSIFKSIITLIFGRDIAHHVSKKNIIFEEVKP